MWFLLQRKAHIYVCGDAKYMAHDIHKALISIVRAYANVNPKEAEQYLFGLEIQHRYQKDVWITWTVILLYKELQIFHILVSSHLYGSWKVNEICIFNNCTWRFTEDTPRIHVCSVLKHNSTIFTTILCVNGHIIHSY